MNAVHSTITPRSTPREFVLLATPWAEAPQPTLQTLLTPPLAGPGSPLKGYAIPITDFELEMFMDGFGDWDELDLDSSDMHKLFPHVAQFFFVGLDPHDREIVAEEVIVPVSTSSDGVPQFWKATAVILAQNDQQYDLDVSDSGELVRALQTRLGVDTYPGWYELTGKGGPNLSPKQLKRLVKGSGSRRLCEMFEFHGWI